MAVKVIRDINLFLPDGTVVGNGTVCHFQPESEACCALLIITTTECPDPEKPMVLAGMDHRPDLIPGWYEVVMDEQSGEFGVLPGSPYYIFKSETVH